MLGFSMRSLGSALGGLVVLAPALCSCVPLVKYQELEKRFNQIQELNQSLERGLRKAELASTEAMSEAGIKTITYQEMKDKYDALLREKSALAESNARLQQQIAKLPAMPMPGDQFSAEEARRMGLEQTKAGALVLKDDLFFQSGRAVLREGPRKELDALAQELKSTYADRLIHIDGHSDVDPVVKSANADNWDLSAKRAHAVFAYLRSAGVDERRFVIHGYGYSKSADGVTDPNSADGKKRCRRVEIWLGSRQ